MRLALIVLMAAILGGLIGRARAAAEPAVTGPGIVTVVARDYSFEAPDTISAGAVTWRLRDLGASAHHLIVFRLDDSISLRDFYERMRPGIVTPSGIASLGGPESREEVTLVLRPGRYVLGCLKDFDDGTTHLSRGMFRPLTVVAVPGGGEPAPRADVTVTMRNYAFELSGALRPGQRILRIDNTGPQDHHLLIQRLEPGRTLADVERWIAGGRKGPRPISPIFFGTSRQSRGETLYVAVNLAIGTYLFICRVPDAADGRPHVDHGMRTEIRVE